MKAYYLLNDQLFVPVTAEGDDGARTPVLANLCKCSLLTPQTLLVEGGHVDLAAGEFDRLTALLGRLCSQSPDL